MKIWKIITVLLAVLLLAGCVSGATIGSIDLKVTAPATGIEKTNAVTTTSGISIISTTWTPQLDTSSRFNAGEIYTVTISVKNTTGNTLASSGTIKINDISKTWSVSGGVITVSHTFPETSDADPISEIKCKLEEPKASNTPKTTVTFTEPTTGLKSKVTWDTTDTKFVLGKTYKATVVIESTNAKAYPITSTATVIFNGETINNNLKRETNKITFTYTFEETEPKGTADILSFTVDAPVVGMNPSNYIRINSHDDKIEATAAWDTTSKFQPDKPYTVTITVLAKEGYVIKSGATAKVNGNNAIIVQEGNNKATVTYTFEEIESISSVNVNFDAPKAGEIAQKTTSSVTTVPYDAADSASISWSPALVNDEFDSGVAYTATVVIKETRADAVFDAETIVYINGEAAQTTISSDYKTITAVYTFPKTFFFPNPIDIIKEFYNLMLAFFNPASYAF